jgi:hypothetical protein
MSYVALVCYFPAALPRDVYDGGTASSFFAGQYSDPAQHKGGPRPVGRSSYGSLLNLMIVG